MKSRILVVLLVFSTLSIAADTSGDRAALLKLHAMDREGHLKGDADLISAQLAPKFDEVVGGHIKNMTREEAKQQFLQYLKSVKFTMWDDAGEPQVVISSDGKIAWMIVETKAKVAPIDKPDDKRDFSSSSIQTFEKDADGWHMTAIAATAGK
jgi:hypothetical protein